MTGSDQTKRPAPGGKRAARLSAALKANMARRKAQAASRAGAADDPEQPSTADIDQEKTEKGQG